MERVQFFQHNGKQMLLIDFSGLKPAEALEVIQKARPVISSQPLKSVRTLTNVTDLVFDSKLSEAMKEYAAHNKPYVSAGAVVGISGLKQIIFNAVLKFSGRHLAAFSSVQDAKDWLARQ